MNLSVKQKKTHGHRERLVVAKGRGVGEGRLGSLGLADVNNKVLLYSTGNAIQYPEITHNEKTV